MTRESYLFFLLCSNFPFPLVLILDLKHINVPSILRVRLARTAFAIGIAKLRCAVLRLKDVNSHFSQALARDGV